MNLKLKRIDGDFSVCKLSGFEGLEISDGPLFAARTGAEFSLVCLAQQAPDETLAREDGFSAFRIEGALDFSLIGILARITGILAREKIGVFVVSTFDTDYVLVKSANFEAARTALSHEGYQWL